MDVCIPYRNLIKPRQAEKRGQKVGVTDVSDISRYTAEGLRHHRDGHCVRNLKLESTPVFSRFGGDEKSISTHPYLFSQDQRENGDIIIEIILQQLFYCLQPLLLPGI